VRAPRHGLSWVVLCVVGSAFLAGAQSDPNSEVANRIRAAIAAEHRSPADTARDVNRKPLETLLFFGLREDMQVLELVPAGGWFTALALEVGNPEVANQTDRITFRFRKPL